MAVPAPAPAVLLPEASGGVEVLARFFRALGDPSRLRLLEFLLGAEHTVTECVTQIGLSQGRVSSHLACLAGCGYVQARRAGRFTWYTVADPRAADLVTLARSLAADNAETLAGCVRIAQLAVRRDPWSPAWPWDDAERVTGWVSVDVLATEFSCPKTQDAGLG